MKKSLLTFILLLLALPIAAGFFDFDAFPGELSSDKPYSSIEPPFSVDDAAPAFSLPDTSGTTYSLAQFRDKKNVLLVFYRGAWCPFCVSHLEDIQNLFPTLNEYNVQLLAISKDTGKKVSQTRQKFNTPYVFLSDAELKTTADYGIRNDKDLPHPAIFLIDKSGNILWYHIDQKYSKRASASQLKSILETLLDNNATTDAQAE